MPVPALAVLTLMRLTLSPYDNSYGSLLANLCPVNVFRPIPENSFTLIDKKSLERVYDEEIPKFPNYQEKLCSIYGLKDEQSVKNYKDLVKLHAEVLKNKKLQLAKLLEMQSGCIFKTNVKIESIVKSVAKEREYVHHSVVIGTIFLSTALLSTIRLTDNESLQTFLSSLILVIPNLALMYLGDAKYIALALTTLVFVLLFNKKRDEDQVDGFLYYVTFCRGILLFGTVIAILAVDSIYFNQYLKKTFYNGFSGMDMGSGFFIAHTGATVALSKEPKSNSKIFLSNLIVLILGVIRWIATTSVDYNVDVEEYGIHWNFFITVAISRMACELCAKYLNEKVLFVLPFLLSTGYEAILIKFDAIRTFADIPRSDIWTANKEGLASLPNSLASSLLIYNATKIVAKIYRKGNVLKSSLFFLGHSTLSVALLFLLDGYGLASSRSLNNLRYCIYTVGAVYCNMGFCLLFEYKFGGTFRRKSLIYLLGKHSLLVFLIANLFTGFVNIAMPPFLLPLVVFIPLLLVYIYGCIYSAIMLERLFKR